MLHERIGVAEEVVGRVPLLLAPVLADPGTLLKEAFATGPRDAEAANALLAAALLSQARATHEGRLAATLALLSRLVAKADPRKTLGPDGAALRDDLMPNGWQYTIVSWPRLRYAWREGLAELLDVREKDRGIVEALDEVTRLSPSEPEPVSVSIQETWPPPAAALALTLAGLGIGGWTIWRELSLEADLRRRRRATRAARR